MYSEVGGGQQPAVVGTSPNLVKSYDIGKPTDTEIASYQWDFGDGRIATGQQTQHLYERSGTFRVKLFITDRQAGGDFTMRTVSVNSAE